MTRESDRHRRACISAAGGCSGRQRLYAARGCDRRGAARDGGFTMRYAMAFLDCPAYMDAGGTVRCDLPAEVEDWYAMGSTDGPLECARIRCPRGHLFNGPIESLTRHKEPVRAWLPNRR